MGLKHLDVEESAAELGSVEGRVAMHPASATANRSREPKPDFGTQSSSCQARHRPMRCQRREVRGSQARIVSPFSAPRGCSLFSLPTPTQGRMAADSAGQFPHASPEHAVRVAWQKKLTKGLSGMEVTGEACRELVASCSSEGAGDHEAVAPFLTSVLAATGDSAPHVTRLHFRPHRGELILYTGEESAAEDMAVRLHRSPIAGQAGRFLNAEAMPADAVGGKRCPRPPNVPSKQHPPIQGMHMLYDFISAEEHDQLLQCISAERAGDSGNLARRVVHYGYCFDYARRAVDWTATPTPIPPFITSLAQRLQATGLIPHPLDQCTVNAYAPGQGIAGHLDNPKVFDSTVVSLSLGAPIVMNFERSDCSDVPCALPQATPAESALPDCVGLLLPPASAMVITGRARYAWTHGITKRKTDCVDGVLQPRRHRVSITFRRVIETPSAPVDDTPDVLLSAALKAQVASAHGSSSTPEAHCVAASQPPAPAVSSAAFHVDCGAATAHCAPASADAAGAAETDVTDPGTTGPDVERQHVHKLYNAIARHFSGTRHSPWPSVRDFLQGLPPHSLVFDLGCGNGKYMVPTVTDPPGQLACIGADISTGLTAICGERGLNALTADGLAVPLRSGAADAAVSIAVLHHLSTAERRAAAVGEVLRVLRPGGTFMIQAWAKEQGADSKRTFEAQDVMVPWKFRTAYLTQAPAFPGGPRPEPGQEAPVAGMAEAWGGSVDAEADRVVFQRYCHVYVEGELAELVAATPGATVTKAWWERGNWCVTGVKDSVLPGMG